jgi:cob(I)alamin adenosyltransferase
MSIATTRGDQGQTGLAGGVRVQKDAVRVEAYGTVDELNSAIGVARAIIDEPRVRDLLKDLQRELFRVGSALATPPASPKPEPVITAEMVERLTAEVHALEAIEGMVSDWSIAGEHAPSAALDFARTVCRRAERRIVALRNSGETINPSILAYVNRLSDLLWLLGRYLELQTGHDARLRDPDTAGNRWSRAW